MTQSAPHPASLLETLARWDTPTICNALEVVAPERRLIGYTTKPLVCPFPNLPPMVGYARTVTIRSVLKSGLPALPLLVGIIVLTMTVNILMSSMSAKWTVLAPILVPMLMMAGLSPELTQAAYRVGDSVTNPVCTNKFCTAKKVVHDVIPPFANEAQIGLTSYYQFVLDVTKPDDQATKCLYDVLSPQNQVRTFTSLIDFTGNGAAVCPTGALDATCPANTRVVSFPDGWTAGGGANLDTICKVPATYARPATLPNTAAVKCTNAANPNCYELTKTAVAPGTRFFTLGAEPTGAEWQTVWQNLDLARYRTRVDFPLQPIVLELDPASPAGFVREWPRPDERIERHVGYAWQWYGFAAASVGIWLFFLLRPYFGRKGSSA